MASNTANEVGAILALLFHDHADTLLERAKTKAFLADALANDKRLINALISAYDLGIVGALENECPLSPIAKSCFENMFISQYSIQPAAATQAVEIWTAALSPAVIRELALARNARESERPGKIGESDLDTELESSNNHAITSNFKLNSRDDFAERHINVTLNKVVGKISIPCGVGTTDRGFYICGIKETSRVSSAPPVFALVYNYLIRNSTILSSDYPHCLERLQTVYEINYQRVYRLMIIALQLIKNGFEPNRFRFSYDGNPQELYIATEIINDYVALFSRLMHVKPIEINLVKGAEKVLVSLDHYVPNGVYVEESSDFSNARELWLSKKINYRIGEDNRKDLEYILREISPFESFKEGQFIALTSMLNSREHSMCIMPTGSGKSLVFYLASLLQPLPMLILAPTEILIEDQIRNLKKFHHIDNVSHLMLTSDNDFSDFLPCTSMVYLTPMTFQSRHLLVKCNDINDGYTRIKNSEGILAKAKISPGPALSYIILDEVHCLSNWGHDFRPEYLTLSKFMRKYLSRVSFLGFTATANYVVVEDIQKQLDIPQEGIFSPVAFEKSNVSYDFRAVQSKDDMIAATCNIISNLIKRGERTLIFVKNEEIARKLGNAIGYEADVFLKEDPSAYHTFADEECQVLIASDDMGIGINLPNIQNIVHFGLPISKSDYVQEVGRAGRADEAVTSYVVYLETNKQNAPAALLRRKLDIPDLPATLAHFDNDYADCYRKISDGIDSKEKLLDNVIKLYREFSGTHCLKTYSTREADHVKKLIYMLHAIGYVHEWYAYSKNEKTATVDLMISINPEHQQNLLLRCKQRATKHYGLFGGNREQIVRTRQARSIEEIIQIYVDWYYSKFLYHHKELFLDLLDFITSNRECDSMKITDEIQEYFTLPFAEIKNDEAYYANLTIEEIGDQVSRGISRRRLTNAERILSSSYSLTLDCLALLGTLKIDSRFDERRLVRILDKSNNEQMQELREAFARVFEGLSPTARLVTVHGVTIQPSLFGKTVEEVCTALYSNIEKDLVYYGLIARQMNKLLA